MRSVIELGEVVSFTGGGTPDRSNPDFWNGEIPWATVKDFKNGARLERPAESITQLGVKSSATNLIPQGTLVIPTRMALGKAAITTMDMAINQDLKAVIPVSNLDVRYMLWYFIANSQKIDAMGKGATVKGITLDQLRRLKLPLPPLPEQRRIAAILDKAEALRSKRCDAIAKLDQLLQSVFLEMFGDPVKNPKNWDLMRVGDIVCNFIGGKNVECPESSSSPYRILKVSAVTQLNYKPENSKPAPEDFHFNDEAIVKNGDLLFSRANTTELVAATAYVWNTPDNILLPDKIWKFHFKNESTISKIFVWNLFKNASFREQITKRSSGTSGSMKNIAKGKLNDIFMPLPPLEIQTKFENIAVSLNRQSELLQKQNLKLQESIAALQKQFLQ